MVKILITDKLAQEGIDLLNSMEGVEAVVKTDLSEEELAEVIGAYDGLIIRSGTQVTAKVLSSPGKLRGIARAGVGVDNVDIYEATKRGIIVMNTPGGNTRSAAEHTMALMLALSRNVVPACTSMKAGKWDRKKYMGNQLSGKTLGVIGLGRIGMTVAGFAKGFNMQLLGYDPFSAPPEAEEMGMKVTGDVEEIFRKADYITVHVPKNDQTVNLIDAAAIDMMKPSVRLINTARGGIINENDAYDALKENKIAGLALDVFPVEPPDNHRYVEDERALVTPHLGASTEEAQVEVALEAAEILSQALTDGPVENAVNAPALGVALSSSVSHYADLSGRIGKLLSEIAPGKLKKIQVEYRGRIAEKQTDPVTTAFSIGLLQKHFDFPLNFVNVPIMAKERGISVDVVKNPDAGDISSSFTARVDTDRVTRTVIGSVFGGTQLRVLEIDGFSCETAPFGTMMVVFNDDKPGVIGSIGSICAKHELNIATMGVGRSEEEEQAVLAISLDRKPGPDAFAELKKLSFVNELYVCQLD